MFTDKTDELQRLLDAGQGRIVLPDGHYLITRPLLISDHTTLVCSPRTHLELADGANCPIIKNREKGTTMTRGHHAGGWHMGWQQPEPGPQPDQ